MIKAKFLKKNDMLVAVTLKGHSNYAEEGSDIVCAAATTLSCAIGDGISNVLKVKADCNASEGKININLGENSVSEILKCQDLMRTLHLGLKNLELNYGMYIKVDEEEV